MHSHAYKIFMYVIHLYIYFKIVEKKRELVLLRDETGENIQ
jgi:hypothetical protein